MGGGLTHTVGVLTKVSEHDIQMNWQTDRHAS